MSENATDARRDGRHPGRGRTVTKIAGLGVVTGALVVAGLQLPASAAATKVLQAVDVQVSENGTLTSISSTTLSEQTDGEIVDDEITHDRLPICSCDSRNQRQRSGPATRRARSKTGRVKRRACSGSSGGRVHRRGRGGKVCQR